MYIQINYMNKTLLNHFTVIHPLQHETAEQTGMKQESIPDLVRELKSVLKQAEKELLSPRKEAVDELLKKALN